MKDEMASRAQWLAKSCSAWNIDDWRKFKVSLNEFDTLASINDIRSGHIIWDSFFERLLFIYKFWGGEVVKDVHCHQITYDALNGGVQIKFEVERRIYSSRLNTCSIEELVSNTADLSRKDFCHHCQNSNLYWHAMAAKCNLCHRIILGG